MKITYLKSYPNYLQVESWPCNLLAPNISQDLDGPSAAILGL
jgi:hypothetical protein